MMVKRLIQLFYSCLVCGIVTASSGCNVINPSEQVPTYVRIDSFAFEGNASHDIKCIWVYYNNNPVGAFDLPATVPIITNGTTGDLQIAAGIMINGLNERPISYPFYKYDISTLTSNPGKIVPYTPKTGYYDSVKQFTISNFEAGITRFAKVLGSAALVSVTTDSLVYEGAGTGAIFLPSTADSSVDSTMTPFTIPLGAAFIEINYNSTVPFAIGIQSNLGNVYQSEISWAGIKPSDANWHKFYFNLTGFISSFTGDNYTLFIKAFPPSTNAGGRLLIDNIKLVTF